VRALLRDLQAAPDHDIGRRTSTTWPTSATHRINANRRAAAWRGKAAVFATASIPNWTTCATSRARASRSSRRWRTGAHAHRINSLKVRYNRVSGTTSRFRSRISMPFRPTTCASRPSRAANGSSPALKEYEEKVLGADERILEREIELFEALRTKVGLERRGSRTPRGPSRRLTSSLRSQNRRAQQLRETAPPRRR